MSTLNPQQAHRISFEAFSQFSSKLFQTKNFAGVQSCLSVNLKYLFDFEWIRLSYTNRGVHFSATLKPGGGEYAKGKKAAPFAFEKELIKSGIPKIFEAEAIKSKLSDTSLPTGNIDKIWCWNFNGGTDRDLTMSFAVNPLQELDARSITFLKLFAENLESKLLQLILLDELSEKNNELHDALHTINEKNSEIQSIIEHQSEVIATQTNDLKTKNKRLVEISRLNAHNVREPLSRIMGLISLLGLIPEDEKAGITEMLEVSGKDLDLALQQVINKADEELTTKLK